MPEHQFILFFLNFFNLFLHCCSFSPEKFTWHLQENFCLDFSPFNIVINKTDIEVDLNMDFKKIDYKNDMDKIYPIKSKQIIGFHCKSLINHFFFIENRYNSDIVFTFC